MAEEETTSVPPQDEERFALFVLEGDRFNAPGVPVDALFELVTYRALIIDVAKQCYLRDHPERIRSRRNMERDFDLRLQAIRPGSADLLIRRLPVAPDVDEPTLLSDDYFDEGRDLVSNAINSVAETGEVPADFPPRSLTKFRNLGRTLGAGDRIRTGRIDGINSAYVTPTVRERFQTLIDQMAQGARQELAGRIVELDTERLVFHLRTAEGARIQCNYGWAGLSISRALLADENGDGPLVTVEGEALVTEDGEVQQFTSVERVQRVANRRLIETIEKHARLPEGWLGDGDSVPVLEAITERAIEALDGVSHLPAGIASAPLPDGGLRFEWTREDFDFVLELDADGSMYMCVLTDRADEDVDVTVPAFDAESFRRFMEDGSLA